MSVQFLKPKEVAEGLDVSTQTVWRWCRTGQIPYHRFNRSIRIRRDVYEKLLEESAI